MHQEKSMLVANVEHQSLHAHCTYELIADTGTGIGAKFVRVWSQSTVWYREPGERLTSTCHHDFLIMGGGQEKLISYTSYIG